MKKIYFLIFFFTTHLFFNQNALIAQSESFDENEVFTQANTSFTEGNYDEAIQDYARYAARDNLEAALAWAERISNEEIRQATLKALAERQR